MYSELIAQFVAEQEDAGNFGGHVSPAVVEHVEMFAKWLDSRPTQLAADWATVAVCPSCKSDYDVEQTMCISCGRPTAKA